MRVIGGYRLPRERCPRRGRDVRAMWTFGMEGDELRSASQCGRPDGHRGDCRHVAPKGDELPTPWRTIFHDTHAVRFFKILSPGA